MNSSKLHCHIFGEQRFLNIVNLCMSTFIAFQFQFASVVGWKVLDFINPDCCFVRGTWYDLGKVLQPISERQQIFDDDCLQSGDWQRSQWSEYNNSEDI